MKGALVWGNPRPGVEIEGFDVEGRAVLPEDRRVELGRYQACDLVIRGAIIGGRRNCLFEHEPDGLWRYQHLGGGLPNFLNGANTGMTPCFLADGDVIEPEGHVGATPYMPVLVFERAPVRTAFRLVRKLAPRLLAAFPARAGAMLAELERRARFAAPVSTTRRACELCAGHAPGMALMAVPPQPGAPSAGNAPVQLCVPCLSIAAVDSSATRDAMGADLRRALAEQPEDLAAAERLLLSSFAACVRCGAPDGTSLGAFALCPRCLIGFASALGSPQAIASEWEFFTRSVARSTRPAILARWDALRGAFAPVPAGALATLAEKLAAWIEDDPRPETDAALAARDLAARHPETAKRLSSALARLG